MTTQTFQAVFENGVLRPTQNVDLPEHCAVEVEVRHIKSGETKASLDEIYALLSERFDSGEPDVASRHNEHQP